MTSLALWTNFAVEAEEPLVVMVLEALLANVSPTLDISCTESPLSSQGFQVSHSLPQRLLRVEQAGVGFAGPEMY